MYWEGFRVCNKKEKKQANKHKHVLVRIRIHVKMALKVYSTRRSVLSIFFSFFNPFSIAINKYRLSCSQRCSGIDSSLFHIGSHARKKNICRYNERRNVIQRLLLASPAGASVGGVQYRNRNILKIFAGSNTRLGLIIIRRMERSISQRPASRRGRPFATCLKRMKS